MADKVEPEPKNKIVARWNGDTTRQISGVPNRDITVEDALSDELLKATIKAGLHEGTER